MRLLGVAPCAAHVKLALWELSSRTTQRRVKRETWYAHVRSLLIPNSHLFSHQPFQSGNGVKGESAKPLKRKEKRSGADENRTHDLLNAFQFTLQ